jgi:hypothetical protein
VGSKKRWRGRVDPSLTGGTDGIRSSSRLTWQALRTAPIDRADPVARQDEIVARRKAGETWQAIALAVGLSPSRVRRLYAAAVHPAPRLSPSAMAIIANLHAFLTEATTMGTPTSRRAYGAWADRLVSPATIVTRFGTWAHALGLARMQELDAAAG